MHIGSWDSFHYKTVLSRNTFSNVNISPVHTIRSHSIRKATKEKYISEKKENESFKECWKV